MVSTTLIEDLAQEESAITGCKLCKYMADMREEEAEAVQNALRTNVQHNKIAAILTKNGYPVTESSVRRHRSNHV